ncbi:MAG TPA: FAD binding domain-containing protein [Ktedonobacterales bacterium]|nr:FAD binding domain-containing protein [Ktedonobacterales bacterium]
MNPFDYQVARTLEEITSALASETGAGAPYASATTRVLAGGTDLIPLMKEGLARPTRLINIMPAALRGISGNRGAGLRIGALTTLAELERDATIAADYPILRQAVWDAATPQLRNTATIGGNLLQRPRCWYFRGEQPCWLKGGDTCFAHEGRNDQHAILGTEGSACLAVHPSDLAPALIALDATVVIASHRGERSELVAELLRPPTAERRIEHTLAADELITAIHLPPQPESARGVYLKVMERAAWSFALASAAAQVASHDGAVTSARLVLGGVAGVPWRASEAERLIIGQALTPELAGRAADAAVAGAHALSHNGYKVRLARELARRALLRAAGVAE